MNNEHSSARTELPRTIGLVALVLYGVGDMLGAGIYGLVGPAAALMGNTIWAAFLLAAVVAGITGLSYASLGSRYPRAGGAAYAAQRAFRARFVPYAVGLVIMASGLTSIAAASRAFSEYAATITPALPPFAIVLLFIAALTIITIAGLRESIAVNLLCTVVEVGGLLFIIVVGLPFLGEVDLLDASTIDAPQQRLSFTLLLQGAVLTFYSFIGFEDMINVSEEVRDAPRVFPIGLLVAVVIATVIYLLVSIVAVSVLPAASLAGMTGSVAHGSGPLVRVATVAAPWLDPRVFATVSLFAIANTALLNFIMASRLSFGMAREGLLPRGLARLHRTRRTPLVASVVVAGCVLLLSMSGDLASLASATSLLILSAFVVVHLALFVVQRRKEEPRGLFELPSWIPVTGALLCAGMVIGKLASGGGSAGRIAVVVLALIGVLYLVLQPKQVVPGEAPD